MQVEQEARSGPQSLGPGEQAGWWRFGVRPHSIVCDIGYQGQFARGGFLASVGQAC